MIGFVTWHPFCTIIIYKGGQVTIMVVKMLCILIGLTLPDMIITIYVAVSDWPRTFLYPGCFYVGSFFFSDNR